MYPTGSPSSEKTLSQSPEDDSPRGSVLIVAFYGVSCMGKSELVTFIREKARHENINVVDISKDSVARPLMDVFHIQNPSVPFTDIFMTIYGQIEQAFNNEIFKALDNLHPGKNIVVIDDAWANAKIMATISNPEVAPNFNKRVICVYPKISQNHYHQDLPFSLQFVLNICHRVLDRKSHETMVYDDIKKVQIVLSFCKLYNGIGDIPTRFQEESTAHEFCPVEFHQESSHESHEMPESVKDLYHQTALCFEKLGAPFETPFVQGKEEVEKLVELIKQLEVDCSTTLQPYLNFGRKSEWEKWYNRIAKSLA